MEKFFSEIALRFGYRLIKEAEHEVSRSDEETLRDELTDIQKETDWSEYADGDILEKGISFQERARDVISDPLNLLIDRVPNAGYVNKEGHVVLHNGNAVPISGEYSYYGEFSSILVSNRGVHEPLEELCFQYVLTKLRSTKPSMLELGAYWAHYSMWLKRVYPDAYCTMVEPEEQNLEAGRKNFALNGYKGDFVKAFVAKAEFSVDKFMLEKGLDKLDILHSDIQGYEVEMLDGATVTLSNHRCDFVFVSTHDDRLHDVVIDQLKSFGYRIETTSSVEKHTTSFDGFVLASSPNVPPLFKDFDPWGREEIAKASGTELLEKLNYDLRSICGS
ncbi:FkbM family methyltransferase [Ruegeria sp. MALMAid1280]|uniref:FkbM family methyltransferase n=1 Tax=Ruegeria sp. MALMAid1280 TaxID=3411634 RepID=UPI003BA11EBC